MTYSGADYHRNINYVTPTPIPEPYDRRNSDDWGNAGHSDEWGSGVPYTGEVRFQENDTYLLRERADTGFIVTSNIDLNGCAMIELTVLGEISYHNLYLFMESADLGSFTTLDGREGTIRFFDDYALLSMDLRFAGIGEELVLRKAQENAW